MKLLAIYSKTKLVSQFNDSVIKITLWWLKVILLSGGHCSGIKFSCWHWIWFLDYQRHCIRYRDRQRRHSDQQGPLLLMGHQALHLLSGPSIFGSILQEVSSASWIGKVLCKFLQSFNFEMKLHDSFSKKSPVNLSIGQILARNLFPFIKINSWTFFFEFQTHFQFCGYCWRYFPVFCCIKKDKAMTAIPGELDSFLRGKLIMLFLPN